MDNLQEMSDVMRRASLISIKKSDGLLDKLSKDKDKPKDTLYMVYSLSLLFGALDSLPLTFLVTANGYWMYKFRDPAKDTVDLNNKTTLEKYFVTGSLIVQTLPSMATMLLATTFGHRFKVQPRVIIALTSINIIFVVFTALIKVNTDTWQVAFFVLTLLGMTLITSATNLFQVTAMAIIPKFPPVYMKTFLFGQGMSSIFNATLQIISLALGTSTEASALFYFTTGTLVIFVAFVLYLLVQHMTFYKYYMQIEVEDKKKKYSKEDVKTAFFRVWPCLATLCLVFLTMSLTHPCITTLVVSENYGNGNKWNDTYFVPTITFLFTELCSQFGRLLSRPIITKSNGPWIVGLVILRMIVLVPLVWFCNAQPRSHFPVLLPHDWQYILVLVLYFVTFGFLLNTSVLSIPGLAKENVEVAYLLFLSTIGVFGGVASPLSILAVRIL